MPAALSLAPLALAVVLGLSGLAKLPAPDATADMVRALLLPRLLGPRAVARALPWVEIATAVLLLSPWPWSYAVGAGSALLLCLAFTAVVAHALRLDPRPDCACFGAVGDHRISARTLARNLLLAALALGAGRVALGGGSLWTLVGDYTARDRWWLTLALVTAAALVLVLARSGRRPSPQGTVSLPDAPLVDRDLDTLTLRTLGIIRPQVVVLVNCWCGPTFEVLERLPRWREQHPDLGVHLVHTHPPWSEPRAADLPDLWWDPGAQLHEALSAGWQPTGVLLDADGLLAGPVSGIEAIEGLLDYNESRSRTT